MIRLKGLTVRTAAGATVLHSIDLEVLPGTRHAIIGTSGSGKTTLALAAIGALPTGFTATGSASLDGQELVGRTDTHRRRVRRGLVAMLSQDPGAALDPTRRLMNQFFRHPRGLDLAAALAEVGLPTDTDFLRRYPREISGGQQRRLALATAIATRPRVLIVDEPTAGLDEHARKTVLDLLDEITQARKMTLVVITHDEKAAERLGCTIHTLGEARLRPRTSDEAPSPPTPRSHLPALSIERSTPILAVRSLSARHSLLSPADREVDAPPELDGFEIHVHAGELVAVVGASGSGKTTLLRAITGLHPASAGRVELNGRELHPSIHRRSTTDRRAIQLVQQDAVNALNPQVPVGVAIARAGRGNHAQRYAETRRLLDLAGLDSTLATRLPHELSGGQRLRVGLCRALAARPLVLLCDESTAALDADSSESILDLLTARAYDGLAIVMVTHELHRVAERCHRISHLTRTPTETDQS